MTFIDTLRRDSLEKKKLLSEIILIMLYTGRGSVNMNKPFNNKKSGSKISNKIFCFFVSASFFLCHFYQSFYISLFLSIYLSKESS